MTMTVAELEHEITQIQIEEESMRKVEVSDTPASLAAAQEQEDEPNRGVERNKSGPQGSQGAGKTMGRRAPPKRSQSHKIGRPVFTKELPPEPVRGVNRNASGRLRSVPNRSRSFGKKVPDRSSSGSSLKAYRKSQQLGGQAEGDGDSVCDSVFTSASNQTLDSIMLRKKQFTGDDQKPSATGLRMPHRSTDVSVEFDESLHTVDSINLHHRHVTEDYDDDQDMSVFSESFASTDTYNLSDFEGDLDEEDGADVKEVEIEDDLEDEGEAPMK